MSAPDIAPFPIYADAHQRYCERAWEALHELRLGLFRRMLFAWDHRWGEPVMLLGPTELGPMQPSRIPQGASGKVTITEYVAGLAVKAAPGEPQSRFCLVWAKDFD